MTKEKLLKLITRKMEEYGMPKFSDDYPARDILQTIKDAGYINIKETNENNS